jgi:hypothetical protein
MEEADRWTVLDDHLPPDLRSHLEETFWRPIEAAASLEVLSRDPAFLDDPGRHPAMFADHGVVHVRDVASGLVPLVDALDGILLAARPPARRALVQTWGVAQTYLHDVGMVDFSMAGRRTHALYAAHVAFSDEVNLLVEHLLGPGPVRRSLDAVHEVDPFRVPLETVVREVLSLSAAHSKSTVPASALDDREELRRLMTRFVFTPMEVLRGGGSTPWAPTTPETERPAEPGPTPPAAHPAAAHPREPDATSAPGIRHPSRSDAYAWLTASRGPQAELADDVVDAVRALRAADVLRQRGTALRTSGGFEVFFDARTGEAVCTLRRSDGQAAYLVTLDNRRTAGEANIRMASVTPRGDLRFAFHRGAFGDGTAARGAAESVANAVLDIQADVIPSFGTRRARGLPPPTKRPDDILVQLERPDDHPAFADLVRDVLCEVDPEVASRLQVVDDVEGAAPAERHRFDHAERVGPWSALADEVLARLSEHGSDTSGIDRRAAFLEVGRATIAAGELLVENGSPPAFVYVPMGEGLQVRPGGGYAPSPLHAWIPVGTTGAVRRAGRNSDVVAKQQVDVLMVPGPLYVRSWLRPLRPEHLRVRLTSKGAGS